MELSYWQSRWRKSKTGWHMDRVYPPLIEFWPTLQPQKDSVILVPLCGKSLDMLWLRDQGCQVIGIDISDVAAKSFFKEHNLEHKLYKRKGFDVYEADRLQFWVGDFMKLTAADLPRPDLIYDKAALIAQPPQQRPAYIQQLLKLCTPATSVFLNTFEYIQDEMNGPPFSVPAKEIHEYFNHRFIISVLKSQSLFDQLPRFRQRGLSSYLTEKVYHLTPKFLDNK